MPHMPAIGDLDCGGRAVAGALGIRAGPVPADNGRAGVGFQPRFHGGGLPVREHVDDVAGVHVDQHGSVHVPLAQGKVVDAEDVRCPARLGSGDCGEQPQDRRGVHGNAQPPGKPGAGPAGEFQPEPGEHLRQRDAPPAVSAGQPVRLHGERGPRAGRVHAAEPHNPQDDQYRAARGRTVGHSPGVPAWTRADTDPQAGQHPEQAVHDAKITTASPVSSIRCTRRASSRGNSSTSSFWPSSETSRPQAAEGETAGVMTHWAGNEAPGRR